MFEKFTKTIKIFHLSESIVLLYEMNQIYNLMNVSFKLWWGIYISNSNLTESNYFAIERLMIEIGS